MLLEAGADALALNAFCESAAHLACLANEEAALQALVDAAPAEILQASLSPKTFAVWDVGLLVALM